jgi:ABC-2 type transport system ATP-binding protein
MEAKNQNGVAIDVGGISKRFNSLLAVDNVSFTVNTGEIFGLLGPNGAGKTTTLEMMEGLRVPDAGSARVLGTDVAGNPRAVKERIGVQLQLTAVPDFTTVREAIQLFGSLYERSRPAADLLREFDLEQKAGIYTDKLSGGQMQRLSIALALVNDPEVVFLDEPTTGLDPQARLNLWVVIEGLRERGKTVVLTTHYMEEAERLCRRVAIIDHGRIVALDTPVRLIAEHAPGTTIELDAVPGLDVVALEALPGVDHVTVDERVSIATRTPEAVLHALLDPHAPWAEVDGEDGERRHGVRDLLVRQGTLEDVFISLTGGSLRS